jgi:hypothetical protein
MDFEKEWASGGHCFISVLTPRDRTADGRLALPSPWVITESGLSFRSDSPHLVFIEKEVDRVALILITATSVMIVYRYFLHRNLHQHIQRHYEYIENEVYPSLIYRFHLIKRWRVNLAVAMQ